MTIFCYFCTLSGLTRGLTNAELGLCVTVRLLDVVGALAVVEIILGQGEAAYITFIYCFCVAVLNELLGLVVTVELLGLFVVDKFFFHFETLGNVLLGGDSLIVVGVLVCQARRVFDEFNAILSHVTGGLAFIVIVVRDILNELLLAV